MWILEGCALVVFAYYLWDYDWSSEKKEKIRIQPLEKGKRIALWVSLIFIILFIIVFSQL